MTAVFDPERALAILSLHGVNFVTIGGMASAAWGANVPMMPVLEVCCERTASNDLALLAALRELEATEREGSAIVDTALIETRDVLRLDTIAGAVNCVAIPRGTIGYTDLNGNAADFQVGDELTFRVASVRDLLRIARAGGQPSDLAAIEILSAVKEERAKL